MRNSIKRGVAICALAIGAASIVPVAAMADRVVVKRGAQVHTSKVVVVKQQRHKHKVGHRFRKQDVVVVKNWRARGLAQPGRNEVYVANGDSIYLAAAATLLVKALVN